MFVFFYTSRTNNQDKKEITHPGFAIEDKPNLIGGRFNRIIVIKQSEDHDNPITATAMAINTALKSIPNDATAISFDLKQLQSPEVLKAIPEQITSVEFTSKTDISSVLKIIQHLPDHITHLSLSKLFDKSTVDRTDIATIKALIQTIPAHITHISLPNLFEVYADKDLASIFGAFHKKLKGLNMGNLDPFEESIEDERLKNLLIHLPVSVERVLVPHLAWVGSSAGRYINMHELFFPKSYKEITEKLQDNDNATFDQALAILKDYTKSDSYLPGATRFFSGHWNRHHIDAVDEIISKSTNLPGLLDALHNIKLGNPTGSLARRIRFIEHLAYENENKQKVNQDNSMGLSLS
ncbi:Dot/Icm secretion system substrate [Legionella beliardensis]|uniref:Dot/Icm secretion system substrate n=1 Tax=Legionella beliardensis TaxID=91822 RepID=A0A378HZJ9_9GAMM|nr:DUF5617 domain-containing protein [Legionella beliardensis]STX27805.1 Dot/Icm secretion system substrate [Legionella beliardensis]